jgi:hypothetical protein
LKGGTEKSGAKLIVSEKAEKPNQKWKVTPEGHIMNLASGLVVDVEVRIILRLESFSMLNSIISRDPQNTRY